jgi:2'-5' RNA ligase
MNMYFIALVFPAEINLQVMKWKLWMKEKFGCEAALRSPAHITLIPPCWMKPELENDLILSINRFAANQHKFQVRLANFSNFKPRVIFVDVVPSGTLTVLQKDLGEFLLSLDKYPFKPDERSFHPHVTIATRDLYKRDFYEAWEVFKEKSFEAEWLADSISLLRHNKKNWDVIATSQFK